MSKRAQQTAEYLGEEQWGEKETEREQVERRSTLETRSIISKNTEQI